MNVTLHVWRQKAPGVEGKLVRIEARDISADMSFLEMLDVINDRLSADGEEPIAFDHDCREGICGSCGLMINGIAHGPMAATTTCQLHMRSFQDGQDIVVEPWRVKPFPVLKDLVVDRTAFDRIIQAGGYIGVGTGGTPDGNAVPIPKPDADLAMDGAACIACGACAAACPNGSAMLFTAAKLGHLGLLPQGQPERLSRAHSMVHQMDQEGFGGCTNMGECTAVCPKEIGLEFISRMNRDLIKASLLLRPRRAGGGDG